MRGDLNTKLPAPIDGKGCLVKMILTPGQDGDGPLGRKLLESFEPGQIKHVLADTAYDGDETRASVR